MAERQRASEHSLWLDQLTQTDRNGKAAAFAAPVANWASSCNNALTRPLMEKVAGVDAKADLPPFTGTPFQIRALADDARQGCPDHRRTA